MSADIVSIHGEPASIDARCEDLALMCEKVAALAREGVAVASAIAFVKADGTIGTLWEAAGSGYPAIGAVAILQAEMTVAAVKE